MARVPLLTGAYQARSIIASEQRCINYFPERNPRDSPTPVTHYQRPGFRALAQGVNAPVRGIFRASNGAGYCVIGGTVYVINQPGFALQQIGTLAQPLNVNPVSFVDNGVTGFLVDGTAVGGWTIDLGTNAFAHVVDPTGAFQGADRVDYLDGYILYNNQGQNRFSSTHQNSLTFDPLFFGVKAVWPDPLQGLIVCRREILLLGQIKSEIWYDALAPLFPFAILQGTYIEHGCVAKYSMATQDISTYWLGNDLQGQGIVWRHTGYATTRISNHALEVKIRKMGVISDAIGYCYQQDGHDFYVLTFPSGDQTWVWDEMTQEWHQRAWTDQNGVLHRDRSNCHANLAGLNVVGDWQNGSIYALDLESYIDAVPAIGGTPLTCIRGFPHIVAAPRPDGSLSDDGSRIMVKSVRADLECGTTSNGDGSPVQVGLAWSHDRGRTFQTEILQSAGAQGEYFTQPQWRQQGIARDFVFELRHNIPGPAALNGLWIDYEEMAN